LIGQAGKGEPPPEYRRALRVLSRRELWRRGDLTYLLDTNQLADYRAIWSRPSDDYVLDVARQTGKSWLLVVTAFEYALRHPGAQIKYASLTQKSIAEIVEPVAQQILEDCPADLAPKYDAQRAIWRFTNGSRITAAGTDNKHYTALRGPRAHLIIKDEAAFFDDPEEVDAVLSPQRMTTKGIIIEASTPPVSPGHPFTRRCATAKAEGRYSHRTIWEHARMTRDEVVAFLRKEATLRGYTYEDFLSSSVYRREYLAEHVIDESRAVVRNWTRAAPSQVVELPRPRWFFPCVGFDVGWRDGMGAVFGYWDYARAAAVIEHEVLLFNSTTPMVAKAIRETEREWLPASMPKPYAEATPAQHGGWRPQSRWMDNALLTLNDLAAHDGLEFQPTRKDGKELRVNELNRLVDSGRLYIHPRCRHLQAQLATTTWNKQRTSYERTKEGHGDLLDALLYLLRNLPRNVNPEPPFWEADPQRQWIPQEPGRSQEEDALAGAFG
jgi:hypothetical protein